MGFEEVAYRGLETGSRSVVSHVIRQNNVRTKEVKPAFLQFYLDRCADFFLLVSWLVLVPNVDAFMQIVFNFESALNPDNEGG